MHSGFQRFPARGRAQLIASDVTAIRGTAPVQRDVGELSSIDLSAMAGSAVPA